MLALSHWHMDDVTPSDRRALYADTAESIALVATTPRETAALVSLGWSETRYAALVLAGRCAEMPVGVRCDNGRARGPWQLWRSACPAAWAQPDGSRESRLAEARCALRLWRGARLRCQGKHPAGDDAGAFAGYARGGVCDWPAGAKRARTMSIALGAMYE